MLLLENMSPWSQFIEIEIPHFRNTPIRNFLYFQHTFFVQIGIDLSLDEVSIFPSVLCCSGKRFITENFHPHGEQSNTILRVLQLRVLPSKYEAVN